MSHDIIRHKSFDGSEQFQAILKLPAELIAAIKNAAGAIWDKYWEIRDIRRREIPDRFEALKWKPFHEIR